MRKFERLTYNFFGVEMLDGEIDISKHHDRICFFIVEQIAEEKYIEKQAFQFLVAGCRGFHFYGKAEPFWRIGFNAAESKINPNKTIDYIIQALAYKTIEDFTEEIKLCIGCRYFVPTDIYLFYDDEKIYREILSRLNLIYH